MGNKKHNRLKIFSFLIIYAIVIFFLFFFLDKHRSKYLEEPEIQPYNSKLRNNNSGYKPHEDKWFSGKKQGKQRISSSQTNLDKK